MIEHHIKFIGSSKKNLFPFNVPENQKHTKNMVNKISNWIYKLESKDGSNEEIMNFRDTLKIPQSILRRLYNIEVN
jgi:hypothetical protein